MNKIKNGRKGLDHMKDIGTSEKMKIESIKHIPVPHQKIKHPMFYVPLSQHIGKPGKGDGK